MLLLVAVADAEDDEYQEPTKKYVSFIPTVQVGGRSRVREQPLFFLSRLTNKVNAMRWKMRKHRFKYAGVKSPRRGSFFSRVVVPVLIFFVLLCLIVLYVRLGTSMIKSNALKSKEEHKDMVHIGY